MDEGRYARRVGEEKGNGTKKTLARGRGEEISNH